MMPSAAQCSRRRADFPPLLKYPIRVTFPRAEVVDMQTFMRLADTLAHEPTYYSVDVSMPR
jgi:hypothetical protein